MFKKDYMMKLLQQLEEALKKINQKKGEGDHESALQLTDHAYQKILKLDINEYDENQFVKCLLSDHSLDFDELNVLAALLKEEGDIY